MRWIKASWSWLWFWLCFATPLQAEDLVGVVYVSGGDLHTETHIDVDKSHQGPRLCPGELDNRIRHLSQLQVRTVGTWQLLQGGVKDCFAASSFLVLRMVSGREAAVGRLSASADGGYLLTGDDGKIVRLADLTPRLRQMMGEQVILDLKPMANPAIADVNKVVVSYRRYP